MIAVTLTTSIITLRISRLEVPLQFRMQETEIHFNLEYRVLECCSLTIKKLDNPQKSYPLLSPSEN